MGRKLRKSSIRGRITLYFSTLVIVIIVCMIVILGIMFTNSFIAQKKALVSESMDVIINAIEERINLYRFAASSIRDNPSPDIDSMESTTYGVQKIFIIDNDANILSGQTIEPGHFDLLKDITQFNKFYDSNREEMFSLPHSYPSKTASLNSATRISYMKRMRRRPGYAGAGFILMNLDSKVIFNAKQAYINGLFHSFYIVDNGGNIIYETGYGDEAMREYVKQKAKTGTIRPKQFELTDGFFVQYTIPSYPEWNAIGYSSASSLYSEMSDMIYSIVLVGIFGIAMVVVFAFIISKRISKPIFEIKEAMQEFQEGLIPTKMVSTTNDELGFLINGFNAMLEDIEKYVETIYDEQEQKKKAEVYAVKYQLESLQSQINPHFLYNTLNTVKFLASTNQAEQITELVFALNRLLRATLSNNDDEITVEDELGFLLAYVKIQSYRFPGLIELKLNVADDVTHSYIPKLILQPIVENAILHGIFPTGRKGRVELTIQRRGSKIHIAVADDGIGMEADILKTVKDNQRHFTGIGLPNVNERLKLLYGEGSELRIESIPNVRTVVQFEIPIGEQP